MLLLNKIWYSQTHLNLVTFLRGPASEVITTDSLENQIDLFYMYGRIFRKQIIAGRVFNRYVFIFFIFFILLHLTTSPFYIIVYIWHLLINIKRVLEYVQNPEILELQSPSIFKRFPNQWQELVYNMTYRRAVVTAFITTYNPLKFTKLPDRKSTSIRNKLTLLLRLVLWLLVRSIWMLLFQLSWQIVSRSYRFAMAFSGVHSYKDFDITTIRHRVINNYQSDDLCPGLYLRIYKTNNSIWNFNPHPSKYLFNERASYLTNNRVFKDCLSESLEQTSLFVHNNHVTSGCKVGSFRGQNFILATNNTSGVRRKWPYSELSYESHIPKKSSVQSITTPYLIQANLSDNQTPNFDEDDFRSVLVDTKLTSLFLVSNLLTRERVMSNLWTHPQFSLNSELNESLNSMKQIYASDPTLGKFYTESDELSYYLQILQHSKPEIFTNMYNFKLHKSLHDEGDFYDGFL